MCTKIKLIKKIRFFFQACARGKNSDWRCQQTDCRIAVVTLQDEKRSIKILVFHEIVNTNVKSFYVGQFCCLQLYPEGAFWTIR